MPTPDYRQMVESITLTGYLVGKARRLTSAATVLSAESGLLALVGAASGTSYRRRPCAGGDQNGNDNGYSNYNSQKICSSNGRSAAAGG